MRLLPALLFGALAAPLAAQAPADGPPPAVFLDCQARSCDTQHFRNEIRFVNWMRDRTDADVYVLVTGQSTGGGGTSFRITLAGSRRFATDSNEIRFTTGQSATSAEIRDALTARLSQGLVAFALKTSAASRLRITSTDAAAEAQVETPARDPWNFWVFSASLDAELDGESREQERQFELGFNADRVTEMWIVDIRGEARYEEQEFKLTDRTIRSVRRDYEANAGIGRAIARSWSAGILTEAGTSSFRNQDLYGRVASLLEYSFFPYEDFSRRRVTLRYSVGVRYFDYDQVTIYDRLTEQRADHELELSVRFRQPWGSATVQLSGAHFLDDTRRNSLSSFANLNVRLLRGLSVDLNGNYQRVRDQIYIPKGDATDEEVLLRRRALETGYRYGTSIGLRYTFGSVYNNVVNPRLDDGGARR